MQSNESKIEAAQRSGEARSLRIAIDCRYIRERPSGIGAYVRALIDRLPALASRDHFDLWADRRARRPLTPFSNVSETVVRFQANSLPTLLWPARLGRLDQADVFHAPFNILGRGVPCPSVVTVHDLIWVQDPLAAEGLRWTSLFQIPFYRDGILRALRSSARIVAISEATAESIASFMPEARPKLRVIPHGVDACFRPAKSPQEAREAGARAMGEADPYFLVIGQNAPFKNHTQILEAFAASGLAPRVRLALVQRLYAGGELVRRARELGIEASIRWMSGLAEQDLVSLIQGALAHIQFSRYEGFGMPVAEAMACGTPVVASDIPALREVLGGAGLTVRLDPAELSKALVRVAGDEGLRGELSARGLERAASLSWDRSAEAHLEVYREAAGQGR